MEKNFSLKLTDEQKKEIANALGIPVEQLALQVAYAEAFEEDAKANDVVIASVNEKAAEGKVWVVEGLAMRPLRADGSTVVHDVSNVAGGLQGGYVLNTADARATKMAPADARATKMTPAALPGQKSTK